MGKTEKKSDAAPVSVTVTATAVEESKNYFVLRLPQRDKSNPSAPMPDETGGAYLSKKKHHAWANAKGAKITIEPIL